MGTQTDRRQGCHTPTDPATRTPSPPWTLLRADCMRAMPRLPEGCASAVITDPPFGIKMHTFGAKRAPNAKLPRFRPILNDDRPFIWWLREAWRVTREGGALICFCRADVQQTFRWAIEAAGWIVRSQVIWDKLSHGVGDTAAQFGPRHEVIWFGTRGRGFKFPAGRPQSVLPFRRPPNATRTHPTEKPVDLMRHLVESVTRPGDLVLDPFAGSGSTGEACLRAGRRFWGCELDDSHARAARRRLTRVTRSAAPQ